MEEGDPVGLHGEGFIIPGLIGGREEDFEASAADVSHWMHSWDFSRSPIFVYSFASGSSQTDWKYCFN